MQVEITSDPGMIDLSAIEEELRPLSSGDLLVRIGECYAGVARLIAQAAVCVKILEERGEDLSGIPLLGTYRRIASGQIDPRLVGKFIESPNRRVVERLPLEHQKKLAVDPVVPVVDPSDMSPRRIDLRTAPKEVVSLAIGPDGLRTVEEQRICMGAKRTQKAIVSRNAEAEDDIREPLSHSITVKLTVSEWEALKVNAALARVRETELARRGLLASGYLKRSKS